MTKEDKDKKYYNSYKYFLEKYLGTNKTSSNTTSDEYTEANGTTTNNDTIKRIEDLEERFKILEEYNSRINQINKNIKKIEKNQTNLEKKYEELDKVNSKNIEIMAIFFTLFTIISVTANISLKFQNVWLSLLFVTAIAFLLIFFLVLFDFILNKEYNKARIVNIGILFTLVLGIGTLLFYLSKSDINEINLTQDKLSVSEEPKSYMQYTVISNSNDKEDVSQKTSTSSSTTNKSTSTKN